MPLGNLGKGKLGTHNIHYNAPNKRLRIEDLQFNLH